MRTRRPNGFTLVEILIVVVILGILAAIVVPQFTNASNEAVKGALQSQLQTIDSQIELFRVQHQGALPNDDTSFTAAETAEGAVAVGSGTDEASGFGWGIMVSSKYLKEAPFNGYTGSAVIAAGDEADSLAATRDTDEGWYFDDSAGFVVFAAGYEPETNLLAHEEGFGASAGGGGGTP